MNTNRWEDASCPFRATMIGVLTESLEGVVCLTNVVFAALQFKDVDVDHWASIGCNVICPSCEQ